jgi:hypothetical protein
MVKKLMLAAAAVVAMAAAAPAAQANVSFCLPTPGTQLFLSALTTNETGIAIFPYNNGVASPAIVTANNFQGKGASGYWTTTLPSTPTVTSTPNCYAVAINTKPGGPNSGTWQCNMTAATQTPGLLQIVSYMQSSGGQFVESSIITVPSSVSNLNLNPPGVTCAPAG